MNEVVLKTENLTKKYRGFTALEGADIRVFKGDIYGLIGRNGAGKTTLMKVISSLTHKTQSHMTLFGLLGTHLRKAQRRLGCMIESPAFFGNLTAYQNLKYYALQKGIPEESRIGEEIDRRPVNVVALLEEVVSWHYDDFLREDRSIRLEGDRTKCMIMSHSGMLKRVFDNLISNGLKHGTGDLLIRLKDTGQEVQVDFQNRIAENNLEISCIFDEFYTSDPSRTKGNAGLGLAIAKGFSEALGYEILAAENPEEHLTFTLLIPIGEKGEKNGGKGI